MARKREAAANKIISLALSVLRGLAAWLLDGELVKRHAAICVLVTFGGGVSRAGFSLDPACGRSTRALSCCTPSRRGIVRARATGESRASPMHDACVALGLSHRVSRGRTVGMSIVCALCRPSHGVTVVWVSRAMCE